MLGTQEGHITHGLPPFLLISVLPDHTQVKTRSSRCTMNWALLAGGCRNGTVGFKKMTKLPNNGNTYNKPIPTNVLFGFKTPLCLHPITPLNMGVYTAHSHRENWQTLFPTQSCFLCPLPEDGDVTRARELHNAQRFMKIRI